MPFETWNGMISSSMNFTHFSRCPGFVRYCRNSKNTVCSFSPYWLVLLYLTCFRYLPTRNLLHTQVSSATAGVGTPPFPVHVRGHQDVYSWPHHATRWRQCRGRPGHAHGQLFQRPNQRRSWLPLLRPTQRSRLAWLPPSPPRAPGQGTAWETRPSALAA